MSILAENLTISSSNYEDALAQCIDYALDLYGEDITIELDYEEPIEFSTLFYFKVYLWDKSTSVLNMLNLPLEQE